MPQKGLEIYSESQTDYKTKHTIKRCVMWKPGSICCATLGFCKAREDLGYGKNREQGFTKGN